MVDFKLDEEKALAAFLYIVNKLLDPSDRPYRDRFPDIHRIFKILYFADEKHLARYGRPVAGDIYIAMEDGPVPSHTYDVVKTVRGDGKTIRLFGEKEHLKGFFEVYDEYNILPTQDPDMDELSESDLECLDESIRENRHLTYAQLRAKSHDRAYKEAEQNREISFLEMADIEGADEYTLQYIELSAENSNAFRL
jgi:uncharacterized phage-associated protein